MTDESGGQIPALDDIVDMELGEEPERRWVVLFEEDYEDVLFDAEDSVALLVDNNQAVELLRLANEAVTQLAPVDAPDEEPIDAIIGALQEVDR